MDEITERVLRLALLEDIGPGDITTSSVVDKNRAGKAVVRAKEGFVLSGVAPFCRVFALVDETLKVTPLFRDGDELAAGATLFELKGAISSILTGERTALNILARLSGIATLTKAFVKEVKGLPVKVIDTRKTTPGLRSLEKAAVRHGGGFNHRFGLFDGVLLKENHIRAAGSISKALQKVRAKIPHTLKIEVEVTNLKELREALKAGVEAVLLDNMGISELKKAVAMTGGRAILEASGGVTLKNVREIAKTGVDLISIGALTHSAKAVDVSLLIV